MLCSSLFALLALMLYEVLFLSMKKGTVCGKMNQGEQEGKTKKKGSKTGLESLGLSRREICVKISALQILGPKFSCKCRAKFCAKAHAPKKKLFCAKFRVRFGTASRFSSSLAQRL